MNEVISKLEINLTLAALGAAHSRQATHESGCVVTWKTRLHIKLEVDLILQLRERAEDQAIQVFRDNLKNLLMVAPAGKKNTLGLDPGFRTGVKVVVVNDTGKLLTHTVIFPHAPQNQWDDALEKLLLRSTLIDTQCLNLL